MMTAACGDTRLSTRFRLMFVFMSSRRHVEAIEPRARDELKSAIDIDCIADIGGLNIKPIFAVGIRRSDTVAIVHVGEVMDESHRPEIGRRKRILNDGIGAVREYAGIADIDAGLTAEFGSEADRVEDRARRGLVGEIGLVEDVVAVGRVLVGAEVDGGIGRVDRAAERTVAPDRRSDRTSCSRRRSCRS